MLNGISFKVSKAIKFCAQVRGRSMIQSCARRRSQQPQVVKAGNATQLHVAAEPKRTRVDAWRGLHIEGHGRILFALAAIDNARRGRQQRKCGALDGNFCGASSFVVEMCAQRTQEKEPLQRNSRR